MAELLSGKDLQVVDVTATTSRRVADAYRRWGKGVHPASLNFVDCFAYALAAERGCPLLYVGNDFRADGRRFGAAGLAARPGVFASGASKSIHLFRPRRRIPPGAPQEAEMEWGAEMEVRVLQRIVALLLALATLADRAAGMPLAVRVVILAILRQGEAVAWAFAIGDAPMPARSRPEEPGPQPIGLPLPLEGNDPAEAARLAASLRALALIFAGWVVGTFPPAVVPSIRHCASASGSALSGAGWRGPAALPAHDTS